MREAKGDVKETEDTKRRSQDRGFAWCLWDRVNMKGCVEVLIKGETFFFFFL